MSAGPTGEGGEGQDFELNLAPIIDCFTVLITYLLVSASFISLDMLEVSVATTSESPAPADEPAPKDPPTTMSVALTPGGDVELEITGKEPAKFTVPAVDAKIDVPGLNRRIASIHDHYKESGAAVTEASVKAAPAVPYKQIVMVVDGVKKGVPKVFLGE
jgi:biopolymer transport protein ExbD